MPLPPSALGRIIENRVIETLTVRSLGGLVCYRPESDYEGTDLHVSLRHTAGEVRLQVKGRGEPNPKGVLLVFVEEQSMPPGDPKFLVVVEYDIEEAEPAEFAWVVPSAAFRRLAGYRKGRYIGQFNRTPSSKDRWVEFRVPFEKLAGLVAQLIRMDRDGEELPEDAAGVRAVLRKGVGGATARAPKKRRKAR